MSKIGHFFSGIKHGFSGLGEGLKGFGEGLVSGLTGGLLGPKNRGDSQAMNTMMTSALNAMLVSSASKVSNGMSGAKTMFTQSQDDKDWEDKKERHRR